MVTTEPALGPLLESRQMDESEAMFHAEYGTKPGPQGRTKE